MEAWASNAPPDIFEDVKILKQKLDCNWQGIRCKDKAMSDGAQVVLMDFMPLKRTLVLPPSKVWAGPGGTLTS